MLDSEIVKAASSTDSNLQDGPGLSIHDYDSELERRAVRKLDLALWPILIIVCIVLIDLYNYGNARVAGLQKDLGMTDVQFQVSYLAGLLTYFAVQLPSNLIFRRIGPALLLPSSLMIMGVVVTFQGLVTSFAGLVAVHAVLGFTQGSLLPGALLYLSGFYTRRELSIRVTVIFSTGILAGTFSSLLAAAIEKMDGIGGRAGWAWIFIIEGIFTVCMGFIAFFVVPSTPRGSRFLSDQEKDIIVARLERDRPACGISECFTIREVLRSLSSPHVIMVAIMQFMAGTVVIGLAIFLPSIIHEMGHSPSKTQLLSAGPPVAGYIVSVAAAFWSDRYNSRGIPIAVASALSVVGFALYLVAEDDTIAYGSLYLISASSAMVPIINAWTANNSESHYRRATSIAVGFLASDLGGILSVWIYPSKNGPKYRNTTILNLVFSIFILAAALINMLYLSRRNKQKLNAGYRATVLEKFKEGDSNYGSQAWMELGDKHPDFCYTL